MNIMQAYTKFNGQYIILISGFSGSGKSQLANFFAKLFNFESMNLKDYHLPTEKYDKEENYGKLKDGTLVLDWDNIWKSIDWKRFNDDVNKKKKNGIIICGFGFPTKSLEFKSDIHVHIKIGKKKLLENMEKYIEIHNDERERYDTTKNKFILNDITYPHYLKLMDESIIDKFININEISEDQTKEEGFSYIIYRTNKWLTENNEHDSVGKVKELESMKKTKEIKDAMYSGYGAGGYYDNVYFPDKHRKYYDFNDQGIDYPNENKYQNVERLDSSSDLDASSDSDAQFLFTTK